MPEGQLNSKESGKEGEFRAANVTIVSLSHFIHDVYPAFLPAILPIIIGRLDISFALSGFLVFLLRMPTLFNPFIGLLADRFNLRYFIIFTPAATAIAMSLTPIADSYLMLCFLLVLAGISSALYHVPSPVMIRQLSGKKIGTGMSFFMVGGELARTIGPIMIIFAIQTFGVEASPVVVVFGLIVSALLYKRIKNISIKEKFQKKSRGFEPLVKAFKTSRKLFILIMGIGLGRAFIMASMTTFLPTFMTSRGFEIFLAGSALSILELAGAAGALSSGTISDKIGRRKTLVILTALLPIFMIFFILSSGWWMLPFLILLGLLLFSLTPITLAIVQRNETEYPASANSIYMTINFVTSSGVMVFFGWIADFTGLELAYQIAAGISTISFIFAILMPKNA